MLETKQTFAEYFQDCAVHSKGRGSSETPETVCTFKLSYVPVDKIARLQMMLGLGMQVKRGGRT